MVAIHAPSSDRARHERLMRALIIGASGQVGAALLGILRGRGDEVHGTRAGHPVAGLAHLDITDHAAVGRAVAAARPDWVFCPAGLSHVDYCEEHPEEAFAINRDGARAAARAAQGAGAGFVFYSSDYVFDGVGGPFGEVDAPRPLSVYGRSKWEGEQAVASACERAIIIRTSVVYGPERQEKNFVYQLIRACREGRAFSPATDQRASPSYNPDVAAASVELATRGLSGLWHVAGAEVLDRYAFALVICRVFGLDASRLTPVATAALAQKARRPLDGGLKIAKAQAALATRLRAPAEGLAEMRRLLSL
jgi:dTDP-4-dehydrorhamnose reductase